MKQFYTGLVFTLMLIVGNGHTTESIILDAKQALLMDLTTGDVLYTLQADKLVPPSSMSKIMTIYMVFNEIKQGRLSFDDTFTVSKKAWKSGGSRMFVNVDSQVKVLDLVRGVIVQSGNDAAVTLAEGIGGSEEAFVELMNQKAQAIGAKDARFINATGWPHPDHLMTLHDLATIAIRTMIDFPEYYYLYGETDFTYNKIRQPNRNPLLTENIGCDGLKTGHTDIGGHGLVASAVQNGRRLLMVINGSKTMKTRAQDAKRLLTWGFRYFTSAVLFKPGETVEVADVWLGDKPKVALYTKQPIAVTVPRTKIDEVKAEVVYKTPLAAPIQKGDAVAKVILTLPDQRQKEYPLYAAEDVGKAGFFKRIKTAFNYLVLGG
jgi:D-alanyl-D-alanine carboxypeptidase (penicillin-binding protein 5/6)